MVINKHSLSDTLSVPDFSEVSVGEICLDLKNKILYTKDYDGKIVRVSTGVTRFAELEDVDLTNAVEGSFFVKNGTKYVATNFIGDIGVLSDVEINNPVDGQYLRYDELYGSFKNTTVTYKLSDLTDVDISSLSNDHTLYYDASTDTFKTRPRLNLLTQLDDVSVTPNEDVITILTYDEATAEWKNLPVQIYNDPSPTLSATLDANYKNIVNSSYKSNYLTISSSIHTISYEDGDYWIIQGTATNSIVNVDIAPTEDTMIVMMLEVRQSSGQILLGGLSNIYYEDGKPVQLSGEGKTDLLTITCTPTRTYVTANALNVALVNEGGTPAFRYDKSRYPEVQYYNVPSLYDDYYDYVVTLLNFESERATGKLWYENKADLDSTVTTDVVHAATDIYTYGIRDYVAQFDTIGKTIDVTYPDTVTLDTAFTIEFYVNYPLNDYYIDTTDTHTYFTNQDSTFALTYTYDEFILTLGATGYGFSNGYRAFAYQNNRYVHIAITRNLANEVSVYVDGRVYVCPLSPIDAAGDLDIDTITINMLGNLNSFRITNGIDRYSTVAPFLPPAPRFGLTGGANDILENIVNDTGYILGMNNLEDNIFTL